MSDLEADLRSLTRSVIGAQADHADHDGAALWAALGRAGITEVAVARQDAGADGVSGVDESGDLEDLAACVEELAAAGRPTPLVEHAVARWLTGDRVAEEASVTLASIDADTSASRLSGTATVRWAQTADAAVLLGAGTSPVVVDLRAPGLTAVHGTNIAGEPVSILRLSEVPFVVIDDVSTPAATTRLHALRSAALSGASAAMYARTKEFVAQREQFGGPLLRIPAVAANLALMKTWLEQVRVATGRALRAAGRGPLAAEAAGITARLIAAEGAGQVAAMAHQLHGAIGVTQEFGLHLLSKQVWAWRDADWSERELALRLGRLAATVSEADYWDEVTA